MADSMKDPRGPTTSEHFHSSDADVTFQTTDNVLFYIHRKNIETHAGGFPPPQFDTRSDVVPLTEDAATLDVLFQFIYPQSFPDIFSLPFELLDKLAEAAEKYQVYAAMYVCKLRIKQFVKEHPVEVMKYAARHDYPAIVEEFAPFMLDKSLIEMSVILSPRYFVAWVKYFEAWNKVRGLAMQPNSPGTSACNHDRAPSQVLPGILTTWTVGRHGHMQMPVYYNEICSSDAAHSHMATIFDIFRRLAALNSLRDLESTFAVGRHVTCKELLDFVAIWRAAVEMYVAKIPKYSDML